MWDFPAGMAGWRSQPARTATPARPPTTTDKSAIPLRWSVVHSAWRSIPRLPRIPILPQPGLESLSFFPRVMEDFQCEACHGSTHAEYSSTHRNDNIQNTKLQGHAGVLSECSSCHGTQPSTVNGGPHGMHPVGDNWVRAHGGAAEDGRQGPCQSCHGTDYRGTVLSRALGARNLTTQYGTMQFWRGFQIGCYACHNGPSGEGSILNRAPSVSNLTLTTAPGGTIQPRPSRNRS